MATRELGTVKWFNNALEAQLFEPNALTLATSDKNGRPSARIVLL
ncbi:MAG: hypothetical protein EOO68_34010, partial [Moraxellaceae bacterium]